MNQIIPTGEITCGGWTWGIVRGDIIISYGTTTMTPEQRRVLPEDVRLLVEKGYLQSDLRLTDKGKDALWDIEYRMHKQVLVEIAKEEKE